MDNFERKVIIPYLFLIAVLGTLFVYKNTPLTGLDERLHFFRSMQIAQGDFLPTEINNEHGAWGGCISKNMMDFVNPFFINQGSNIGTSKTSAQLRALEIDSRTTDNQECFNFAPSATYSPLLYLPSAIGIKITQALSGGVSEIMFAGRLSNLIFYIALLYALYRVMPIARIPTLFVMTFPTLLNLASSYSADPITNLVTMFYIACCLRMMILKENLYWQTLLLGALVGLLKMTNVVFLPFIFLVPAGNFSARWRYAAFTGITILTGCFLAVLWNSHFAWEPRKYWNIPGDISTVKQIILSDPLAAIAKLSYSIWVEMPDRLARLFATFGGGPSAFTWTIGGIYLNTAILLTTLYSVAANAGKKTSAIWAAYYLIPAMIIGSLYIIYLALWFGFSPINSPIIGGVQGRYYAVTLISLLIFLELLSRATNFKAGFIARAGMALTSDYRKALIVCAYAALITSVCSRSVQQYNSLWY